MEEYLLSEATMPEGVRKYPWKSIFVRHQHEALLLRWVTLGIATCTLTIVGTCLK